MGTYQANLPTLRPPQAPPNQLEQLGQIFALKNAIQTQPLQQQALQQQVQAGQMENQQRQIQLNDSRAMTKAMQQWDGKDINQLVPLVVKNGGSAQAVMGLKQKALGVQKTLSDIASQDATTGSKNLETLKSRNDLLAGALNTVGQLPDDQIAGGLVSTAQNLVKQGLLDPQHAQAAAQLAQSGDPKSIREQLSIMEKSFMGMSAQADLAQKQAQTQASQADTAAKNAQAKYYAANGGAPGVSAEIQQQNDWIKKHPGKGPSDYKLWTLQHTPSALIMGNMLAGPQNSDALDLAANNYRLTGQLPSGLYRSPGTTQAIIARAAQLDQQAGGSGIAANKSMLDANRHSLDSLQKNYDQVQAFEQTAEKNMDLLQQTAKDIGFWQGGPGWRYANIPVRMISSKMLGTENMAKFKTALATAQTEAAKVLNSSNATGVLSDSSRHELQDIIDGNVSYRALVGSLNTLKQDMSNRTQSYQLQIGDIQNRIKGTAATDGAKAGGQSNPAPLKITLPSGKQITID